MSRASRQRDWALTGCCSPRGTNDGTVVVAVRLQPETRDVIAAAAARRHLSVAAYLRTLLEQNTPRIAADQRA